MYIAKFGEFRNIFHKQKVFYIYIYIYIKKYYKNIPTTNGLYIVTIDKHFLYNIIFHRL